MALALNRLNARQVATITKPGRHGDGGGLYLVVDASGARRWLFLFRWKADPSQPGKGKLREMGLGSARDVSLASAREAAAKAREMVRAGVDPIEAKRRSPVAALVPTFGAVAEAHIAAMAPAWRNSKHVNQWRMTLSVERGDDGEYLANGYCTALRDKAVSDVTTEDVLAVLTPIWAEKNETASRVAGGDENSSTDMGAMVTHLDYLRHATKAHLLVVHHSGKDASKGARGHSLLRAATDTEIEIQIGRITVTKQRDLGLAWPSGSCGFSLDVVELGRDEDGDPITSCVVVLNGRDSPALTRDQLDRIRDAVGDQEWGPRDSGRGSGNAEWIGVPVAEALGLDLAKRSDKARTRELTAALLRCGAFREIERERRKRIAWGSAPSSPDQWCDSSPSPEDAPPNLFD